MKWCFSVRKDNKSYVTYQKEIKEGWHSEMFGLRKWRVVDIIPAEALESRIKCYFVEMESTILFYLEMLYHLHFKNHSNSVFPYWFSERGIIKT